LRRSFSRGSLRERTQIAIAEVARKTTLKKAHARPQWIVPAGTKSIPPKMPVLKAT
jgi:hypothetical protein